MASPEPAWETYALPPRARVGGFAERRGPRRPLCATSGRQRRGWRGRRRWRVPQCFAASRCPEPARSPLPGPGPERQSREPGSGGGGTARDVAGAFSPAAHTFLRALQSHKGQLLEFPSVSNRPGRAVVEVEKVVGSGHEGDGHWGVTSPLVTGRVTPRLRGRERRPRLPLARPPLPFPQRRPAT